jgi:predicted PurR-regulated permease PerM
MKTKKKNWKGYAKAKARRKIPSKPSSLLMYIAVIFVILVVIYLISATILPQVASLLANNPSPAIQSPDNITKTATINFVYVK